jgi:hypothetical protein
MESTSKKSNRLYLATKKTDFFSTWGHDINCRWGIHLTNFKGVKPIMDNNNRNRQDQNDRNNRNNQNNNQDKNLEFGDDFLDLNPNTNNNNNNNNNNDRNNRNNNRNNNNNR